MTSHPHENPHHPHGPLTVVLFAFVFLLAAFSVHESGTWLHIRTGADILAHRALPVVDTFSYTVCGRPWTTDSWLSDVVFKHLDQSGPWALPALKCIVIACAFVLLLPLSRSNPLLAAGVLAVGAAAAWPGMTEMPVFFDFLLLALFIRVLRLKRGFAWSTAAQVAVLSILWANLDGETAFLGLWLVALKVVKTVFHAERGERLRFGALLAAALAGLALNPHGWLVATKFFLAAPSALAWRPFSDWFNLYALFAVAGAAACWICLQQEFFLALSAASLLAFSLVAPSLRPLYELVACPVITLAVGHFVPPWRDTAGRVARLAAVLAALFAWHWFSIFLPLGRGRGYGTPGLEGAVNYLKANGVGGRMFNEPETGDELLALSGRPVFVDSRSALYGPFFMKDAALWPRRFRLLAETYRFDYAVILNRRAASPARILDEDADWRLAYADDSALVYLRRSGSSGWLAASRRPLAVNRLWPDVLDSLLAEPGGRARVLDELGRWIVQSPESAQALLWKAYALDRLNLARKAEYLIQIARGRPAVERDPELAALLAFVLEKRGRADEARRLYAGADLRARRLADAALEGAVSLRLGESWRLAGDEARAARFAARANELAQAREDLLYSNP